MGDERVEKVAYPGGIGNTSVKSLLDEVLSITVFLIGPSVFTAPVT